MNESIYDRYSYPPLIFPQSHPDRLASVAVLLGMTPPDVAHGRVLELGCASGGNLIAMAELLPGSQFWGIDLSTRQIEAGQQRIAELGLSNIWLTQQNILDFDLNGEPFDYIIAHGIYSWVPADVQEHLLAICRARLTPNGIAYVSYNTLPGWYQHLGIREMVLFHTEPYPDPVQKVTAAKAWLKFVSESLQSIPAATPDSPLGQHQKYIEQRIKHFEALTTTDDILLLADDLHEINEPLYFTEFMRRAAQHNLQYLAEADLSRSLLNEFPPSVMDHLLEITTDLIELEQYADYIRNRQFRQSLLCHREIEPLALDARHVVRLQVGSDAHLIEQMGSGQRMFISAEGTAYHASPAITQAALTYLIGCAPRLVPFDLLYITAYERAHGGLPSFDKMIEQPEALVLAADLLQAHCLSRYLVKFSTLTQADGLA